jgi:hypothetical protein
MHCLLEIVQAIANRPEGGLAQLAVNKRAARRRRDGRPRCSHGFDLCRVVVPVGAASFFHLLKDYTFIYAGWALVHLDQM